ncbi:uncharacterized protein LOC135199276 [Macrobrachium nipponense]|uniref:uncharacterized protein LOC135199276 n=1 Tax=Macrobrachium nipponense TaxID=159736 RepID=UPI0030C8D456
MEKQGTTLDSTRLSLDVANLPLTPFGMAHRGSGRKKQPVGSPNRNKLSLKTVRSPAKGKAENKPQTNNRKTNRQVSLLKSFNALSHTGQTQTHHSQEISTNLTTVYESDDTEEGECFAASERPRIPEVIPKFSANAVIIQEQNTDDADGYNRKRESIFTDIDDGSFVEFYYGKENNPPVQIIKEQRITIPQLYYTCDSNNETHFSTSTKAKGAVVGFRKFIEKMKYDNTIHEIVEESPDGIFPPRRNFPTDETIITGSLDVLRSAKKTNPKQNAALNSTMIRSSLNHQNYPDICLPDISTLTLQVDTNSGKSSPNTSPFAGRNCHTTVVLESPEHDKSSGVNPRLGSEALQCEDEVVLRSNIRSDSSCHSNINAIPCAVYVERDRHVKDRIGKEIFYNPCEQNSLISEDVSVVDSLPNERPYDHFNVIPDVTKSQNNPHSYVSHGNVDNKRTCKTQNDLHMKDNASSERRVFRYSPQKLTSPHPDLNSPEVARWILTSPFKEGSKGSSFLLRRDTFEGSETPSCPRVRNAGNSANKFVPQSSPVMDEVPRFSCAKDQVPFQNSENTPDRPDQVSGRLSRNVVGSVSSDRYFSPSAGNGGNTVSNWIMTSPFEDGSYGSSFLLQDVPSDISQTVSQHKPTQVPDSDGTCEKSHYLRVQERIKTCNRSLLSTFQNHNDGGNKHSSDCENNDDGMRSKSKTSVTQNIVISESDDSFGSKQDLESLLKNVNTRKRINKSCISQSTELFSEDSESLHLKLSGAFTRSLKTSEKSLYTVGKDAVSPKHKDPVVPVHKGTTSPEHKDPVVLVHKGTVSSPKHKDPVGSVHKGTVSSPKHKDLVGPVHKGTVASPKHKDPVGSVHKGTVSSPKHKDPVVPVHKGTVSSPKHKVPVTPKLKDAPSDAASSSSCTGSSSEASDSESFIKPNIASCNRARRISESDEDETSYVLLPDITESGEDRKKSKGTKESFLKGQQEFNKKSLNNKNGRPKRTTKKLIEYITSDEDSSSESSFILSGTKVCKNQVTQGNEETRTSNMGKKMSDRAYSPSGSSESEDESSFEDYLRSVKKKIHEEKVAKTEPLLKTGLSMESFINDDESGDDVSFYLPPLSERLKPKMRPSHNLDGRCVGSVSSDLEARIMGRQSKKNISKENGNKPKFSKSPISTLETPTVKEPGVNMNSWRTSVVLNISSDSDSDLDSDVFPEKEKVKNIDCPQSFITPGSKAPPKVKARTEIRQKQVEKKLECSGTPTLTFLASLSSTIHTIRCHPDALLFVKNFKKKREELCQKLYSYYNEHVFSNKLPSVMSIKWNARLTKTAGYCYYQIDRTKPNGRGARIELSSKVIDVPERLRDTLIHEMCHAAAWIISGYKDGHGPLWKSWAAKARSVFPELPAITTCHSYEINCKYTYRCTKCSYSIGRHSKSLDTERKVCGLCYGKFELIVNSKGRGSKSSNSGTPSHGSQTPRTPGAFALFVKENYNSVKKSRQNLKHVDVMKILSADFAKLKTGSN